MQANRLTSASTRIFDFLCQWILPLGLLILLSGMFYLRSRSALATFYLGLFGIPSLLMLCLRPREIKTLLGEPIIAGFLALCIWLCLSVLWSPPANPDFGMMKIPLQPLMLFAGCAMLLQYRNEALKPLMFCAAIIALVATISYLVPFISTYAPGERMIGRAAFTNPLLSSHLFGFFCIYWLCMCITTQRLPTLWLSVPAMAIMLIAIIATGSRTPLVALVLSSVWLSIVSRNRRALIMVAGVLLGSAAILLLFPEILGDRGGSYRLQIWQVALGKIAEHPWIGHGYNSDLHIDVGIGYLLAEPHNFALGVLYYIGIIGMIPWAFVLFWGLLSGYRQRLQPLFVLASTLLVYGIGAGLTEGGAVLTRPREHWFLLWIPLALIAGLSIVNRRNQLAKSKQAQI
ncbi:O-antigen ligase family protein [Pseudomonas gingeri]|uniref:O-antigen ligase family protein n=1 Tax=Pseudomonas gingeri TaxID=117681 RepID=UPI0015A23F1F|nr:O-antigen ligase family protein [Pseudomonas gingeri]NWA28919.1 O-antigen ligase family protein [Pseudomonas gingeri]NWD66224.1 O-antigen ligase family protein [Pseudomonas gingeri]